MARYILRRLVTLIITLLGIMVVTFFISLVVPMDPLASIAGPQAPQETVERLRILYGFDQPIYVQFGRYMNRLLHGDLGTSFQTGRPVLEDILQYFPATIELATLALIISIIVGIPLGVLSAVYRNSPSRSLLPRFEPDRRIDAGFLARAGAAVDLLFQAGLVSGARTAGYHAHRTPESHRPSAHRQRCLPLIGRCSGML